MRLRSLLAAAATFALTATAAFPDVTVPPVTYPALAARGANAAAFVPAGWKLESSASGDLNGDGRADLAIVLRGANRRNIVANPDGLGQNPFDTNPRILAVLFGQATGGYRLALENHTLIPRPDNPVASDFLEDGGVKIERGVLKVTMSFFLSAGGWGTAARTYTFRWQNSRFELIGFDKRDLQRNTGEMVSTSINYSTRKVRIGKSTMENDSAERVTWRILPAGPLLSLAAIGDGIEFEPAIGR